MVSQIDNTSDTGTLDEHYNLISVLYHALEACETYDLYAQDAEEAGDDELAEFFQEVCDSTRQTAEKAKKLLAQRMSQMTS